MCLYKSRFDIKKKDDSQKVRESVYYIRLYGIRLGTVYRNLSLLSETGQILKLNMRDSADRFDGRITPHDHFVCERCHCVEDIFLDDNEEITIAAQKKFDGKIRSHTTTFYGICKKCLA